MTVFFLSVLAAAALAQQPQPAAARAERVRKSSAKDAAALNTAPADTGNEAAAVEEELPAEANGNQENFEEIMGSFSELAMKFSKKDSRDIDVFVYECRHISAEAFGRALEPFLSVNGELADCRDADLVIISDETNRIERLKKIAESIDRPVRQVIVSASVVEFQITDSFEKDLSIQYNQFRNMSSLASGGTEDLAERVLDAILPTDSNPASLSGSSAYTYYDPQEQAVFSSFLTFLDSSGTAEILSSPSLVMRRGHTANILSGEDIPITKSTQNSAGTNYSVDYKSVGIKLRVTPESIFDRRVVLEVSPEVSNIIRYEESAAGRNPVIAIRNANTMLEMNDGCMVSIGGLLREEQIETKKMVPILGNIPLLGTLFRSSSSEKIRSQLVIFLTVNIVDSEDLSAESIGIEGASETLQQKVQASRDVFPPQKRSLFNGIKKLFR
jgi:type II secretory pathway component GspD/PulD (secretin)